MAVIAAYCSLILLVAALPSGSVAGKYTLGEMVDFLENMKNVSATLGEEMVKTADGEIRVKDMFGTVSELMTKHAQEAMLKMKCAHSCRILRLNLAMGHFGARILTQVSAIATKLITTAAPDIQKHAQICAAVALSHKEATKGDFDANLGADIKDHIAQHVEPEEKANAKTDKYTQIISESMYTGFSKKAVEQCIKVVSANSVKRLFDAMMEKELDESYKIEVGEPEDKELYKVESKAAAKTASLDLLYELLSSLLQAIRETFLAVYPSMLLFHDGMLNNIGELNPNTNEALKLPSTAGKELVKQAEWARVMYCNVCIGKNVSKDTIYKPLGEVNLEELNKETIPTKTLMSYQEKLKAKIREETQVLPDYWRIMGPLEIQ